MIDRDLDAQSLRTLPERMGRELTTPRFTMLLVSSFGIAALFFAAIGTYGLLSYLVSQRTREIGIRLALGAQPAQVLRSVVQGGLALAAFGLAAGLAVTMLSARLIRTLVVGVPLYDPVTLGISAVILLVVAAAAGLVPAFRASRVDPVLTLNAE